MNSRVTTARNTGICGSRLLAAMYRRHSSLGDELMLVNFTTPSSLMTDPPVSCCPGSAGESLTALWWGSILAVGLAGE
jgi:hypothetical protein